METLIHRVRAARFMGMDRDAIVAHFTPEFSIEDVFLAFVAVTILES